jgi:hypothetical protein
MFARNTSWCSIQQSVFTPRVFWHHTCWVWIEISTFFKCDDAQFDPHRNFCPFHCPNMLRQKMLKTRSSSNGSLPAGWFPSIKVYTFMYRWSLKIVFVSKQLQQRFAMRSLSVADPFACHRTFLVSSFRALCPKNDDVIYPKFSCASLCSTARRCQRFGGWN